MYDTTKIKQELDVLDSIRDMTRKLYHYMGKEVDEKIIKKHDEIEDKLLRACKI